MHRLPLPRTALMVSRFSFGTASLHYLGANAMQVAHLRAAAEAGFSHFDTAPLYGFGTAEAALGEAFGGTTPDPAITIATKVGLYPRGGADQSRTMMLARKVAGKAVPSLSRARTDWHLGHAKQSLSSSLKRLKRECLDLLLLHEPEAGVLETDEWLRWLEDEAGRRVGAFGIAGPLPRVAPFVATDSVLAQVVQVQDSLDNAEADILAEANRPFQLTYGYLSTPSSKGQAEAVLANALRRNATGSIVVSTRNPARLDTFARVARNDAAGAPSC